MDRILRVGDHASWSSEVGMVRGRIVRVHINDTNYECYVHHASPKDPQDEIKSDETEHVALRKRRTVRRLSAEPLRVRGITFHSVNTINPARNVYLSFGG